MGERTFVTTVNDTNWYKSQKKKKNKKREQGRKNFFGTLAVPSPNNRS